MNILIGSDHSGFKLKEILKKFLQGLGHTVFDFGCYFSDSEIEYEDDESEEEEGEVARNVEEEEQYHRRQG